MQGNKKVGGVKAIIKQNLRCQDCSGYERERLLDPSCNCASLGQLVESKACSRFIPDVSSLVRGDEEMDQIATIAEAMRGMSTENLRKVAALLLREPITRKYDFTFMQRVYVRYRGVEGNDYLSNFCIARVLDVTKDRIRLVGETNRVVITLSTGTSSVYRPREFAVLRKRMMENNRYIDPAIAKFAKTFDLHRRMLELEDVVDTPHIDSAMEAMYIGADDASAARRRRRASITDFAKALESGHILNKNFVVDGRG